MAQLFIDRLPGRAVFVALLVLPVVMSPIVAGATWSLMFDNRFGPINQIIGWLAGRDGRAAVDDQPGAGLSGDPRRRGLAVDAVHVPAAAGRAVGVDQSQLEAAAIDGAGYWRTFSQIVLPAIWPVMAVAILIRGLDLFGCSTSCGR